MELIAHRGFSAVAPENTLSAFSAACRTAAHGIEFDLHLSADGTPVVIHDARLNRTTNGWGRVRRKPLARLKRLDAGSWFDRQFAGEPIPTLEEVLALLAPSSLQIYPEVKQGHCWGPADIDRLVALLASPAWADRCVLVSFDDRFLQQVRDRAAHLPLGFNVAGTSAYRYRQKLERARDCGNALLLSEYRLLLKNPKLARVALEGGIELGAWTVDCYQDLQALQQLGVVRAVTNSLLPARASG